MEGGREEGERREEEREKIQIKLAQSKREIL